jgi:hypothetical protein
MKVLPPPYSKKIKKSFDSTSNRIYLLQTMKPKTAKKKTKKQIQLEKNQAKQGFLFLFEKWKQGKIKF